MMLVVMTRRRLLFEAGGGIGSLALGQMLAAEHRVGPHFAPRAKAVISLFMMGGVSHVDTFDRKPMLDKYAGQPLSGKGDVVVRQGHPGPLMPSPFTFQRHGQSGLEVSELFPRVGARADQLALIRSVVSKSNDHVQAAYALSSGVIRMGYPSLGSWVTYGLGSESRNLPGFVVLYDPRGGPFGGPSNWSSGFMPAGLQGTVFRSAADPIFDLRPPAGISTEEQRARLALLGKLNSLDAAQHASDTELTARIESYELAYRMQTAAPEAFDVANEPEHIRQLYGLDKPQCAHMAAQCLMARRMIERGVRFVQIYSGGMDNQLSWDCHMDLKGNHGGFAAEVDQPFSALLTDLAQRGLLDETLVVCAGEFGRLPISQKGDKPGRDHNPHAFTAWLAGGGVRAGAHHGATDDIGHRAAVDKVSIRDFHATLLHALGLDHDRLIFPFQGLDQKLTGVEHARVVQEIFA